ncbi:unnamed protein product [Ilex paraguariensis]|uniref:Uncharacterized protein n=1 Tax=Ilex paraguariensis TaxID=185542 RepID=A0ABC8TSA9_9AQUA
MLGRHPGMGRELRLFDPGAMQERYRYGVWTDWSCISYLVYQNSKPSAYEHIFLQDITGKWTIVAAASAANLSTVLSCERIEALYQGKFDGKRKSFSLLKWVFITFLRPPKNLRNYGSWALITGSTDGIGKAFAFKLAQKGLNLILVSRNFNKLNEVSTEIHAQYRNTQIKIIVLNFSGDVAAGVREMEAAIEGLEVGVLINNVGVTYSEARLFHEVEEEVWMNVVRVNLVGTSLVTRAVLPGMIKRRRGAIVNIGSGAAIVVPSHPLYAIYAATKALFSCPIPVDKLQRVVELVLK